MAYGIQMRNSGGALALDTDECFPQLVRSRRVAGDWSGTLFISNFDLNRGMFYVALCYEKRHGGAYAGRAPDAAAYSPTASPDTYMTIASGSYNLPTLNWNNDTKIMTVTPADLPPGFPGAGRSPDYYLKFIHFKKRVSA